MPYRQITEDERYQIAVMRGGGASLAAIGRALGRHPSSILRELLRNRSRRGRYEWYHADCVTRTRRRVARRYRRFGPREWATVRARLEEWWSPEQVAALRAHLGEAPRRGTGASSR